VKALFAMGQWYETAMSLDPDPLRMRQRAIAESADGEVQDALQRAYQAIVDVVADVIRRGQGQGLFTRAARAEAIAWAFIAHGQAMDAAMLMGWDAAECAERFGEMGIVILRAMLSEPDAALALRQELALD
jgi:hypothetical protein